MDFNLAMLIWVWILSMPLVLGFLELGRTPSVRRDSTNPNRGYVPPTTARTVAG
jgi:hypothetical protein